MTIFLGSDFGTSSVKLLLINEEGNVIQTMSKDYPVYYPKPGWAYKILKNGGKLLRKVLRK